jgi:multidrug resistance protein MdtO
VLYNAIDWRGISTSVTTCLLTSLSTIGASRQKQILRFAGAVAGGFVLGMGSQVFILPYFDSITGFLFVFVIATALSSWVMTSSPRLSYFGVQAALAFYLVNAQEFKIQTSLAVARDRVVGILLGLFIMWFVFDRLWSSPASVEMKRTLASNLRLLAEFVRIPRAKDLKVALVRSLALRETINANLDKVRALADVVLFEFGPSRQKDLELRSRIREWQPQLRTLFIMRIAALKYRLQLPGFELPEIFRLRQQAYDEYSARMLDEIADEIEGNPSAGSDMVEYSHELLNRTIEGVQGEGSARLPAGRAQSFITLLRRIDSVTTSLAGEIAKVNWPVA